VHYKNSVEVAAAIRGMTVERAKAYLKNVLQHKEAIPFKIFKGGRGRHAQAKNTATPGSLSGWPRNATKFVLNLVENAEANAVAKSLDDVDKMVVTHAQVNMAPKGRRRTYRAHGRIGPYLRVPAHIEIIITPKPAAVKKSTEPALPRLHTRVLAKRMRVPVGGGAE